APEQRRQLDEHLATCADCQSIWSSLGAVEQLFRAEPMVAPRPGFANRFNARLAQQRSRPRLVWGALALGLGSVGAAAFVIPFGVWLIYSAVRVAQQPATNAALFSGLNATGATLNTLLDAVVTLVRVVGEVAVSNPLAWAAAVGAVVVVGVWLYFVRKLSPEVSVR
ncbi:MAG: anti-sigma factor family protein, partial [Anaerolineales bacterium]